MSRCGLGHNLLHRRRSPHASLGTRNRRFVGWNCRRWSTYFEEIIIKYRNFCRNLFAEKIYMRTIKNFHACRLVRWWGWHWSRRVRRTGKHSCCSSKSEPTHLQESSLLCQRLLELRQPDGSRLLLLLRGRRRRRQSLGDLFW